MAGEEAKKDHMPKAWTTVSIHKITKNIISKFIWRNSDPPTQIGDMRVTDFAK